MNSRQKNILRLLLDNLTPHYLVSQLAEEVGCSEKTIRTELKKIEEYLLKYSSAKLIRKQGVGVFLEVNEDDKSKLYQELASGLVKVADEDRLLAIAYELLMASTFVRTQKLADAYYVTKVVVKKDIERIQYWLIKYDLLIISKQKSGLFIEGAEPNKRKALACISELVDNYALTKDYITKQFKPYEVDSVRKELKKVVEKYELPFTLESQERLIQHTLLVVKRMKLKQITFLIEDAERLKTKSIYHYAKEFLMNLERVFAMRFPSSEILYVTLHFLGAKIRYSDDLHLDHLFQTDEDAQLESLVEFLVENTSRAIKFDFKKDEYLIKGIKIHLYAVLNRLKYGLSITNPLLSNIKTMYPYIYNSIVIVLNDYEELYDLFIPEEEIAYITLHFQAALERFYIASKKVKRAIIICELGIGMSQLLRAKIERKSEDIQIVGCYSIEELPQIIEKEKPDFIIATLNMEEKGIPVIQISSLFSKEEEKRLTQFIEELEEEKLMKESVLAQYTNPFLVFLHCENLDRLELIEHFSTILYNRGYVQKEYIKNILAREQLSSTSIGSNVAIPHGNPKYVNESVILIATLKKPIKWDQEEVSLVLMLAIQQENQATLKRLFQDVLSICERPILIQKIVKESSNMNVLIMLSE